MTMSSQIAIIGAGRVAQEHVKGIIAAGVELVGVYDQQREQAEALVEFAQRQQGGEALSPRMTTSLDELLSMDVPAVVVAVPNVSHAPIAIACLNAGKHVLLEKPMAMNVQECDSIIEAMSHNDRMMQIGFVCRASPKVQAVRKLVQSGVLGEVYHVKASMYRQRGIPGLGGWFTNRAMSGGGVLIDIGVHLVDLVMYLTGATRARTVCGMCERRFGWPIDQYVYEEMWAGPPRMEGVCDVEDSAAGFVRFDTGMTSEINVAWASNTPTGLLPDGILLLGERGGVFFDLWGEAITLTTQRQGTVVQETPDCDLDDLWNRAWREQHSQFAAAVQNRTAPMASAQCGRAVQEIIAAWHSSGERGREVVIDQH